MKTRDQVLTEIVVCQKKEKAYKGTLNHNVYLCLFDTNGKLAMRSLWKNYNVTAFDDAVTFTNENAFINKFSITNQYTDWQILVIQK